MPLTIFYVNHFIVSTFLWQNITKQDATKPYAYLLEIYAIIVFYEIYARIVFCDLVPTASIDGT